MASSPDTVFTVTGLIGLAVTLLALRTRYYRRLPARCSGDSAAGLGVGETIAAT